MTTASPPVQRPVAVYTDIVDTDPQPGVTLLEQGGFEVRIARSADHDVIASLAEDADALLVGYSPVDRALLQRLPRVRIIATQSVGVDMVDVLAATAHGAWVANVPGAATEEVATHALAMTLSMLRGLPFLDRAVRAGRWDGNDEVLRRPCDVTVGIIGLGRIGTRFAELVRPMVRRVVGFDPFLLPPATTEVLNLDGLLAVSDVLSLHVPLSQDTAHLLNRERLRRLPAGAFVVNASRAGLVDHEALRELLDSGHLAGAALDVLPQEPPRPDDPLVAHPRTLLTPHAAYLSDQAARNYVLQQAENVVRWRRDGVPASAVNVPSRHSSAC